MKNDSIFMKTKNLINSDNNHKFYTFRHYENLSNFYLSDKIIMKIDVMILIIEMDCMKQKDYDEMNFY